MKNKSLPKDISDKIVKYIIEEKLNPGDRLPNEYELMQLYGVGRNTIRESLKILSSRNIITIKQGSGTYISQKAGVSDDPLGLSLILDREKLINDILDFRIIIEPTIAELAAQNATEENIRNLEKILNTMESKVNNRENFLESDQLFHIELAKISNNIIISKIIPIITEGIKIFATEVSETEYTQTLLSHKKLFNAVKDHKPKDAKDIMAFHILFNKERYHYNHPTYY